MQAGLIGKISCLFADLVKGNIGEGVEEAALEVGDHRGRVTAQRQDLQQRRVAHEVEPAARKIITQCANQLELANSMLSRDDTRATCQLQRQAVGALELQGPEKSAWMIRQV